MLSYPVFSFVVSGFLNFDEKIIATTIKLAHAKEII
jgi:hypothetical protein